jgi:hypothetical protein
MKKLALLIIIVTLLVPFCALADPPSLKEYSQTMLSLKKNELVRLQNGETGVEGYALFGTTTPAYLLTGDIWTDQLVSTPSRITVLNEEIAFLEVLLIQLNQPSGGGINGSNIIAPIADSYVYAYAYRNWNKANLGKYNILRAGWLPTGGEKRAYLKFDLSGVNPANVGRATLKLFHNHTGGNNSLYLGVHRVTGPWQEGSDTYHSGQTEKTAEYGEISWVNQPSFDFNSIAYFNPGAGTNKWVEVDITPLVKAWLSGTPNYGLVIKPRGIMSGRSPVSAYGFYSREFEDVGKRPLLVVSGSSAVEKPDGDITWDFETGRTNGWVKTGTAFNHQPTYGDNPTARRRGQPSKHIGNYWIGTYEKYQGHASQTPGSIQGDGPKGTLTSNVFTIPSGSLSFLVGGGSSFQTRVELLVSGKRVLHVSGRNTETMHRVKWNLNPWAGQQGQIRLVDNASGGWGHINADDFRFSHSSSSGGTPGGIRIESATYGGNCGVAKGNVTTHIARQCNGKPRCRYTVDHKIIGDPAPGCAKTYTVRYRCGNNPQVFEKSLAAEAGWGDKSVLLECVGDPSLSPDPSAGGVSVESVADSHVYAYSYRNWNKANWGAYNILGAGWHPTGGEKRTYLKFDLSGVDPNSVGKATLKLFHYHTGGNNSLSLGVHRVTGTWQEGGGTYHSGQTEKPAAPGEISWVNQPSFNPYQSANFTPGPGTNNYIEVDITKLVKQWLSGVPNNGLVLKATGNLTHNTPISVYGFYSREDKDKSKHPVLVLSGSGWVQQPGGGLGKDIALGRQGVQGIASSFADKEQRRTKELGSREKQDLYGRPSLTGTRMTQDKLMKKLAKATDEMTLKPTVCKKPTPSSNVLTPKTPSPGKALTDITVSSRKITISFWDHGKEDGDIIDILLNGKVLRDGIVLTKAPQSFTVDLQGGKNVFGVRAVNEGSISPNTATVKFSNVTQGKDVQVYEIKSGQKTDMNIKASKFK